MVLYFISTGLVQIVQVINTYIWQHHHYQILYIL